MTAKILGKSFEKPGKTGLKSESSINMKGGKL